MDIQIGQVESNVIELREQFQSKLFLRFLLEMSTICFDDEQIVRN